MKKNSKLIGLLLLAIVITAIGVFGLSSCGGTKTVEQIYVNSNNAPRLNYVQGQDLDLNGGILTVVIDGQETLVPMTSADVVVTGYNKDQLGPQTLTVTYLGLHTTTINANVVARATAESYAKDYFINDPFKKDQGRIRIAKDDATTFTVNLSDEKVTVVSFDSKTAGTKTVTLQYSDGTNTYTCSFNVTVYDAADVKFTAPTKKNYYTHETEPDFNGGYLTIIWGDNQKKSVNITKDMVKGFDLSVATEENRTTPVVQTLTITYLNKTFTYDIKITYSGVTVIENLMPTLNGVNLDGDEVVLTPEQASAAVEAITEYYKLQNRHKQALAEEDVERIVRCATAEVNRLYIEAFDDCANTLALVKAEKGYQLRLTSKSYEDTVADLVTLKDENHGIHVYSNILYSLISDFADLELPGEKTVKESIMVIPEENYSVLVLAFEHIVKLHETISVVPEDWTVDTLSEYEEAITTAVGLITRETFAQSGMSSVYNVLSGWRGEKNDFFEIIYSYYMYVAEDGEKYITETLLNKLPMPKGINKWYSYYYNSMYISSALYQGNTSYYLRDVTEFMYYFHLLIEETKALNEEEADTLTLDMYRVLKGDIRLNEARTYYCGYYYHAGIMAESQNFVDIWSSYLDLFGLYREGKLADEDGKLLIEENAEKFDAIMADFTKLSPSELYGFVSSMNFLYANSREITLVLSKYEKDEEAGYLNTFSVLLNAYYSQVLDDNSHDAFAKLMSAVEYYALIGHKEGALDKYVKAMTEFNSAYAALSASEVTTFDTYFYDLRTKYVDLFEANQLENGVELDDDTKAIFDEILSLIDKIYDIQAYIQELADSGEENPELKEGTYIVLFALYEKANYYYDALVELSLENEDILNALYNNRYVVNEKQTTLEAAFHNVGTIYWRYITGLRLTMSNNDGTTASYCTYDVYISTNLRSYLSGAADLLYAQYTGDYSDLTYDYIIASLNAFHGLDRLAVSLCRLYEGAQLHYDAVSAFYANTLKDDEATLAVANKIIDAARKYLDYALANGENRDTLKAEFIALIEEATALRESITDSTSFDEYLKTFYDHYVSIYTEITNPQPDETPEEFPEVTPEVTPDVIPETTPEVE